MKFFQVRPMMTPGERALKAAKGDDGMIMVVAETIVEVAAEYPDAATIVCSGDVKMLYNN